MGTGAPVGLATRWYTFIACITVLFVPAGSVLGQSPGGLEGRVVGPDGAPLGGVLVRLEEPGGRLLRTDTTGADGAFAMAPVAPGQYTLIARGAGAVFAEEGIRVQPGQNLVVTLTARVYYLEHILVEGSRGMENLLDRPVATSGFNQDMVLELGMNNNNDLEMAVPGLLLGHRAPDSGHSNHIYLRGIGSQRHQEYFNDVAVATYVDGVYTDELYALEPGNLWDVERVTVARGPQGTEGGNLAVAGSIHYETVRPTNYWDARWMVEATDQVAQRFNVAVGGPLGDSGVRWRFTGGRWTGDGAQLNVGPGGDYDSPDQFSFTGQAAYRNDRFDINLSVSGVEDRGSPRTSVELYGRDVTTECLGTVPDPNGEPICVVENPFYGSTNQAPSVTNCDLSDPDQMICEGKDLQNIVDYNRSGVTDAYLRAAVVDATFQLSDALRISYTGGYRETENIHTSDTDGNSRVGSATDPFVAADGKNGGDFVDTETTYVFYSEQLSHELSVASTLDGPLQFEVGLYIRDADEPSMASLYDYATPAYNVDNSADCESRLPLFGFPLLSEHGTTSAQSAQGVWACPGALPDWSNTGRRGVAGGNFNGQYLDFFAHATTDTRAAFLNGDYRITPDLNLFAGLRFDRNTKSHVQNDIRIGVNLGFAADLWWFRNQDVEGFDAKRDAEWNQWTWATGFEYTPGQANLFYGRLAKGGRAGGFAGLHTFTPRLMAFDSEELYSYELGYKGLTLGGRLQVAASAYYLDYTRYWVSSSARILPVEDREPGGSVLEEALRGFGQAVAAIPDTWIAGVEVEGAVRWTRGLMTRGFYALAGSAIGPYDAAYCCDPRATTETYEFVDREGNVFTEAIRGRMDFTGNRVPMQPTHKASVSMIYDPPVSPGLGSLRLITTLGYTSARHPDISNIQRFMLPSYTRWDARAIWYTAFSDNLQIHFFAKNLLNHIGVQQWDPIEGGGATPRGSLTDPRELGIQLLWRTGPRGR